MELRGRRVLITGASRGIGEAIAREVAARGAAPALVARSSDVIRKLAEDLGGSAHPCDLGDTEQLAGLVHRVEDEAGPVDVLVNNAGLAPTGGIMAMDAEVVTQTVAVNLTAPIELCRQAIPRMLRRGAGHIVNVSSLAGVSALPGMSVYNATKAGLDQLTASLRADLKGLPIGTTLVELGPIPTEMLDGVTTDYAPTERAFNRAYRLHIIVDVPREAVAKDVADAIERGRRHVRLPRRSVLFPVLGEVPRRITELLMTGVKAQP
jgi:short-subunit dehydrogenase